MHKDSGIFGGLDDKMKYKFERVDLFFLCLYMVMAFFLAWVTNNWWWLLSGIGLYIIYLGFVYHRLYYTPNTKEVPK